LQQIFTFDQLFAFCCESPNLLQFFGNELTASNVHRNLDWTRTEKWNSGIGLKRKTSALFKRPTELGVLPAGRELLELPRSRR